MVRKALTMATVDLWRLDAISSLSAVAGGDINVPTVTQKRLGDGFYEQQLVREQVSELTGKRFLGTR